MSKQDSYVDDSWGAVFHGAYSAWGHVVVGFLINSITFGSILSFVFSVFFTKSAETHVKYSFLVSMIVGIIIAVVVYWGKWQINEAFSSNYCSGSANISLFYVPIISAINADYRFIKKIVLKFQMRRKAT